MAFLVLGCPLILSGILLFLWALVTTDAKDTKGSPGRASALLLIGVLVLPLAALSCSETRETSTSKATPTAFDPSTATARVFGTVSLEGAKLSLGSVTIRQDPFCQTKAKEILKRGALVTDEGILRNVIVYVRSGYQGQTYAVPSEPVVLDQQECVYLPHVLTLMKGQKLKILNSDPTFHNVHAVGDSGTAFNIPQPQKGVESIQTFSQPAMPPFRIGCDFHNWMVAYAGVFEHPFHTATGDTGKFELRLPPGRYEIAAWHEKFGEQVSNAEVAPNAAVELNFKFSSTGAN
jgi:plastocyanin